MFGGLEYLWMLFFVMIVSGIAKEHNLFMPIYSYIKESFKSNRVVLFLTSAAGGVLPIEGRVTVSAGVLDTMCKSNHRHKMGVVDYLSTHHYYLWSPLEKTVIIPMAAFGISYSAWIWTIWPLLLVSAAFISYQIFYKMKEDEIEIDHVPAKMSAVLRNVLPFFAAISTYIFVGGEKHVLPIFGSLALYYMFLTRTWDIRKIWSYIRSSVLLMAGIIIVIGNIAKGYEFQLSSLMRGLDMDPATLVGISAISLFGFCCSFVMGSSGKFVALATLMSVLFGTHYFLWFFTIEYAGYLLSPTHKCVLIGNKYFGTPMRTYYKTLGAWCVLLLMTAGLFTFVL